MVRVQSSCFANQTYCSFLRSRYRPRSWILKSLLYMEEGTKLVCRKSELVCGKCKGSPKRGLISNIVYYQLRIVLYLKKDTKCNEDFFWISIQKIPLKQIKISKDNCKSLLLSYRTKGLFTWRGDPGLVG